MKCQKTKGRQKMELVVAFEVTLGNRRDYLLDIVDPEEFSPKNGRRVRSYPLGYRVKVKGNEFFIWT